MIDEVPPDLGPIAARALREVLTTQLRFLATESDLVDWSIAAEREQSLVGAIKLTGPRVSGDVQLELPDGFVTLVTGLFLGRRAANVEESADMTGELCNMLAGRVAADLSAAGYTSTLSTPTVSRGPMLEPDVSGARICRSGWTCEGHLLTVMLKITFRSR